MEKELQFLSQAVGNPSRPYVAIIGGAKISGKIDVINNLLGKVDALIIGGGMMFTFLKAMGKEIGNSILEADKVDLAKELLAKGKPEKHDSNFFCPLTVPLRKNSTTLPQKKL